MSNKKIEKLKVKLSDEKKRIGQSLFLLSWRFLLLVYLGSRGKLMFSSVFDVCYIFFKG